MSNECETITVQGWDGLESVVINKSDFDPKVHVEYGKAKPAKPKAKAASVSK